MNNTDKIKIWIPDKFLFPPFQFISWVNYPPFCCDVHYHTHNLFQVLMIISGQFDLVDPQGKSMSVKEGEILIIPPEKPHAWNIGTTGCKAFQIIHAPMLLENYGELSILFGNVHSDWQKVKVGREVVNNILHHLKAEFKVVRPADSVIIFAYLLEIFTMAFRSYSRKQGVALKVIPGEPAVKRVLDYIQNHYREKISLNTLTQISHLGVSRFSEIFRESTDCSPIKYLNKYRLEKARIILTYADMSVKEVAYHLGFESIHYFSRAFKKHFGRSPSSLFQRENTS